MSARRPEPYDLALAAEELRVHAREMIRRQQLTGEGRMANTTSAILNEVALWLDAEAQSAEQGPVTWRQYQDAVNRALDLEGRLGGVEQLALKWIEMANLEMDDPEGDPAVATARKLCAADLRDLVRGRGES